MIMMRRGCLSVFGCALALLSPSFAQTTDGGLVVDGLPNNALTAEEKADGYQLLWNGLDFTGWLLNDNKITPSNPASAANWSIVTVKGLESNDTHKSSLADSNMLEVASGGASLFTKDSSYKDFDLKVEWKAVENLSGNSGILIHYQIQASTDNNYSAPEYQICNDLFTQEWKSLTTTAGCNYDMLPLLPSRKNTDLSPSWVRAKGHWNQSRIVSFGNRTAHYGNSLRLMEYEMLSPAWKAAYEGPPKSKYFGKGIYGTPHGGAIFIQDHGEKWMKFRNIRIKKLTQNPWAASSPYLNKGSGKDSTLLDTISIATNFFPTATPISKYTIVPKIATRIVTNDQGLAIHFSQSGDYSLSLEDINGAAFSVHKVKKSSLFFLPGQFIHRPRILTIWNGSVKIQETVVGR
jgi:hypothetical protein